MTMKKTTHYKGHRWTDNELKKLMALWASDVELDEIASQLLSTRYAILKQIIRLRNNGIPLKRRDKGHRQNVVNKCWTQGDVEYLIRRREEKASAESIAIELDRTINAVQTMINNLRREGVLVKMRGSGVRRLWDAESLKIVQQRIDS